MQQTKQHADLRRAIFLDRDGVLNRNVFYRDTAAWESPRSAAEFALTRGALHALQALDKAGYLLFMVSNQPNEGKGKSLPGSLAATHMRLLALLGGAGIALRGAYYCTHHPLVTGACVCRKPSPWFLQQAAAQHGVNLQGSWMIGDRATDMECGRRAGTQTAWVCTGQERERPLALHVDLEGRTLPAVARLILQTSLRPSLRPQSGA